jgi:UDP-N-acetylmuramoyl-tripeptide--D-alanyl-D-alanine ligase
MMTMSIEQLYELFTSCSEVTIDSRRCTAGALFFSIKGDTFDGNQFALKALENGCRYAVIDDPQYAVDDRFIVVENALVQLQKLAHYHRLQLNIPVIAITGTNGKTTTKELIASVLNQQFNTWYTQGNLNNHIGVPLTLLQLNMSHQMAVIEMGASHPGEIRALAEIAAPDYGLITNIGKAHLEGFGSFEGVVQTKGELYEYIHAHQGTLFVHVDNSILMTIADKGHLIGYSTLADPTALIDVETTGDSPFLSVVWKRSSSDVMHEVVTHLIGNYNVENVAAAICIGAFFGISPSHIREALETYEPINHRSQFKETERNHLIVDAYNANPSSMKAAIVNFEHVGASRKGVILADMLELGDYAAEEHQAVVDQLKKAGFDNVWLVGEHFSKTISPFKVFPSTQDLTAYLATNLLTGYTLLVKGSHGMHLESCLSLL